ncbi:MAG: response regulator, partial [Chamaesiphon sp.]|nr:response regulator [Chamaesiphon sp.]
MSTYTERTECKILIVEDSQDNRELYRECLASAPNLDCQIRECESAEEALEMCIKDCPDLILLDYLLTKSDGLQFLRQASDRLETMPSVIMVTGNGSEKIAVEAMKHGVKDYVVKGRLTPEQLVNTVVNTLNDRQLKARIDAQLQQREVVARIAVKISQSLELSSILQAAV